MKIKESNKQNIILSKIEYLKRHKVLSGLLVLIVYSGLLLLLGGILHKEGFFGEVLKPALQENIKIPFNYIKGLMSNPEHITIDIKHKDYQKLAFKRKMALEEGVLHPFPEDYVPAKITWNGKTVKVNIRLKGDLADHWSRDYKWSLRIKTKGNNTIMGMKKFSIQHPRTRGFLNDWFLHKILKYYGFIALRYDFVDVTINGKDLGIYVLEEHFEKKLIENNKYTDAPIIRIRDNLLWYLVDPKTGFSKDQLDELYSSSPIDAFNTGTVNQSDTLLSNFKKAKNLLESFRRGKLLTHQVFNIDKLSKLFAVMDLYGYRHTTAYSNIRFYYDPITSRLVPIGYDNTFIYEADSIEGQTKKIQPTKSDRSQRLNWKSTFFKDKIFFEKYIKALDEISDKRFLDTLFNEVNDEYKETLNIIYSNFPGYNFDKEKAVLYKNQEFIRKVLNPLEALQAYFNKFDKENKLLTLELGNIQFLPIEVLNASFNGYIFPLLQDEIIIQTKTPFQPIDFKKVKFKLPEGLSWSDNIANNLKVTYKIIGTNNIKNISVFQWSYLDEDFLETDFIRQEPNYKDFNFIEVDEKTRSILIKRGNWNLDTNLIIPKGFTVICGEGTQLNLSNSAKILSYSPLQFIGSEKSPIVIYSNDLTGQGIVVINADKKSILKNVIFKNLSIPSQSGWQLSGAVTFYESSVDILNCQFIRNMSGVGLNIIRAEFTIDKSYFKETFSDALSVVFGKGRITKTSFIDSGRDGINFSGSVIEAKKIYIKNALNRAVSVGENSQINIKNIEINNAKIAVESRDMSKVIMEDINISDCDIGFVVFQKKSEFGPATIIVKSLKEKSIDKMYIVGKKSLLTIDGKDIEDYKDNVSNILQKFYLR